MDPALRELVRAGPEEVAAILRLLPGEAVPSGVRVVSRMGEVVTVRAPRASLPQVREAETVLSAKAPRLVAAEPVVDSAPPDRPRAADSRPRSSAATGRGVVVAVLDWGCDFAHADFRRPDGRTRLLALWDQRGGRRDDSPEPYRYGRLLSGADIDAALAMQRPYERLGYHPGDADPSGTGTHGTHVLSIAAGRGSPGGPAGMAPDADLLFVHLASIQAEGLANLGDSVTVLEAIDFVHQMAGDRPCVINASIGRHGGPHDGTTLVEHALDWLVTSQPDRCVVQSCGNYYERDIHSSGRLLPGTSTDLRWSVDEADVTPNELEVWYDGRDRFSATITSPDEAVSVEVERGDSAALVVGGRHVGHAYHRAFDPNNGRHHLNVFLGKHAPTGEWLVTLTGVDVVDGRYHAWVERDASCPGCQSQFDPDQSIPRWTTGTICHAPHGIAVGAYDAHDPAWPIAPFSSSGPTVDGRGKPDCLAPGVRVLAARSTPRESAHPVNGYTRKSGTSMAAPFVAGTVARMYQAAQGPLSISEVRAAIVASCTPLPREARDRAGAGYLDPTAAVRSVGTDRGASEAPTEGDGHRTSTSALRTHGRGDRMTDAYADDPLAGIGPGTLFDIIVYGTHPELRDQVEQAVETIAYPGQMPAELEVGDLQITRVYGEGDLAVLRAVDDPTEAAARLNGAGESLLLRRRPPADVTDDAGLAFDETTPGEAAPLAAEDQPNLRRGSRGPSVRRLQSALVRAGYEVSVDGVFGSRTESAVRAFQQTAGLTADGVVGPATWQRLGEAPAPAPTPAGSSTAHGPDIALGTLTLQAPGRSFSYTFTPDDLVWTAKLLVHEAGGRDDADNAAVLWAMFNRYALFTHRYYSTFTRFLREYSTTLQPVLRNPRAAARHMHRPPDVYVRAGGTYPGTDIPRGQLRRHLDIQAAPWGSVRESARTLATRALTGSVPNPGIGLASEFASTRIYFRQRHGRDPSPDEWRQYTIETAARRRWRWVGPVPGIDQMKNAFFLDLRAARLPQDAVVVHPPAQIQPEPPSPSPHVQTGVDPHRAGAQTEHQMAEEDGPPRSMGVPFAPDPPPGSHFPVRSTHPRGGEVSYTTATGRQVGRNARQFGAPRSNGRRHHAGIDLFARRGDEVIACQDGRIVNFYAFCCGDQKTSWALVIDHGTVAINYGEVAPDSLSRLGLTRGATVRAGQVVAYIGQNPGGSSMLHFETYTTGTTRNYSWAAGNPPPARLLDPTRYLLALAPLRSALPPSRPILRSGSRGPAVRDLQHALTAAGFPATVDGAFGPGTDAAVRAFQRARGLTPDGVVGPRTWAALTRTGAPGPVPTTSGDTPSLQAWGHEAADHPGEARPGEAVTDRFGLYDGLDVYRATT